MWQFAKYVSQGNGRSLSVISDAEQTGELGFKKNKRSEAGIGAVKVVERAPQQIVEIRIWVLGFHRQLQELAKIAGQQGGGITAPQPLPPLVDGDFPEMMEIAAAPSLAEGDLTAEKQIDLTIERAFRPSGSACHGFDQAEIGGEPMHDKAGFREASQA